MIREKLCKYFLDRGFKKVDLHHEQTDLFYLGEDISAQLVWILSNEFFQTLNKESYLHYYNKLINTFISRGFERVNIIALVLSDNPKNVQLVASGTPFWVVDETYGRVVVYENQPEDFLGIRKPVEAMISMISADEAKSENASKRPGAEGYTDSTANDNVYYARYNGNTYGAGQNVNKDQAKTSYVDFQAQAMKRKKYREFKPIVVIALIIVNFIVLLLTDMFEMESLIKEGANSWVQVFKKGDVFRLITCTFLHGGIDHFIGNMIILFAAGSVLERVLGHWGFLIFYVLGGIGASLGSDLYYWSIEKGSLEAMLGYETTSIGASGAVFAVVFGLLFFLITHRKAGYMIDGGRIGLFILYIAYTFISGFASTGVDNAAHISGALCGGLIYLIFRCVGKGESRNV